jgi:hypothetical protein
MADTLKQKLAQRKAAREAAAKAREEANKKTPPTDASSINIPEDQKQKGLAKLQGLVLSQALVIANQQLPAIIKLAEETLGIDLSKDVADYLCPADETIIRNVIGQFNNTVDAINNSILFLDKIKEVVNTTQPYIDTTEKIIGTLNTLLPILSTAVKAIPPPGLPGAIVAAVDDVDFVRQELLFTSDGLPRLSILKSSIGGVSSVFTLVQGPLSQINDIVIKLSEIIKKCLNDPTIVINELDPTINSILPSTQTPVSNEDTSYNGYSLQIEEQNFSPTLIQRRAVAKNNQNITVIATPYSFTTDNQTLIEELKSLIDTRTQQKIGTI